MDDIIWRCIEAQEAAARKYDPASAELQRDIDEIIKVLKNLELAKRRRNWPIDLLTRMYRRQDGLCGCGCGEPLPALGRSGAHVDHVVPWAKGGQNNLDNLQLLLARCNWGKGTQCDIDELIRTLEDRLLNLLPPDIIAKARVE